MKDLLFPVLIALLPTLIQKGDELLEFDSKSLEDGSDKLLKVAGQLLIMLSDGKLSKAEKKEWFLANSTDIKGIFEDLAGFGYEKLEQRFLDS